MSYGARAYARTSQQTSSPREIEAQALLKAARQLKEIQTNWSGHDDRLQNALMFNRRLWCIFFAEAESSANQSSTEIRQGILSIAAFVFAQTLEIQIDPAPTKLTPLIDINCQIAAGLAGRP
jgi:flagellar biosynthesis activator protein FlaF